MSNETKWTPINGYEICEDGGVISHNHNWRGYGPRLIKWSDDGTKYPVVRMVDESGKRRKFKVHQLVCRAFHGERPLDGHEVRHLDGNPMNNHASNLCWGTRRENALDRARHGRTVNGRKINTAKLNEVDVAAIRERAFNGECFTKIAKDFPVSARQVGNIVRRESWRQI